MTDQTEVRYAENVRKRHFVVNKKMFSVLTGQTTGNPFRVFIRIRLKIEQNYRLFLDIFFSAIMNDLFMTFISRLKVDAKCVYQQ